MAELITFESELLEDGHLAVPEAIYPALAAMNGKKLKVVVGPSDETGPANDWFRAAYDLFAPVREEAGRRYSSEQIDQMIDEAVNEVRKRNRP